MEGLFMKFVDRYDGIFFASIDIQGERFVGSICQVLQFSSITRLSETMMVSIDPKFCTSCTSN